MLGLKAKGKRVGLRLMDILQNIDNHVIIWIAIGALVVLGLLVVNNKARQGAAFGLRLGLCVAAVLLLNFTLGSLDFFPVIGLNALTITTMAFLGAPGIILLYGLSYLI